jgi:hypothetical protein
VQLTVAYLKQNNQGDRYNVLPSRAVADVIHTLWQELKSFNVKEGGILVVLFVLYRSMYCLCVDVYCTSATG